MKVNIKFKDKEVKQSKYPYIGYMKNNVGDYFVLFTAPNEGFILKENEYSKVGRYADNWGEEHFVPFKGSIVMEN